MSKLIDYLVMGVPRSGTTGFVHYLNAHEEIFCGRERFKPMKDHTGLSYPASFLDDAIKAVEGARVHSQRLIDKKGDNPSIIGNKMPRYYLYLQRLLSQIKGDRVVWIYRPAEEFVSSWNKRAITRKGNWWPGQYGVFGAMELRLCLTAALTSQAKVLVVPLLALREAPFVTMERVFTFLNAQDPTDYDRGAIDDMGNVSKSRAAEKKLVVDDIEARAIDALGIADIDRVLNKPKAFLLDRFADQFADHEAWDQNRLFDLSDSLVADYDKEEITAYATRWKRDIRQSEFGDKTIEPV